ncbi:HEAT repeat domain-containing protein [Asanoa iriomotensis]|uniref:HEAT repeat protein n=1 Tax=Asanoa iriomotensis TaxID=234613 RepID=A0ABQ4BZU9_9ACTN|nr:HEAT repeat domain-containing protein [Asanoa iriomotensis]GIF56058.1 hypothetical protein Air01nite_21530 [Asanoa iriomotensis]
MIGNHVVRLIAELGPAGDPGLVLCLTHPNRHVREQGAWTLVGILQHRRLEADDVLPIALRMLRTETGNARRQAIRLVGELADPGVFPQLDELGANTDDGLADVIEAARRRISARAGELPSAPAEQIRHGAADVGDGPQTTPADAADYAWWSTEAQQAHDRAGAVAKAQDLPELLSALRSGDAYARSASARALAGWPTTDVVDALIAVVDDDAEARWSAAATLVGIGTQHVVRRLAARLRSLDPAVLAVSAYSLGEIGGQAAQDALLERFPDAEQAIRPGRWGVAGEAAVIALAPLCASDDDRTRYNVAFALGDVRSVSGLGLLVTLTEDADIAVAWRADDSIGEIMTGYQGSPDVADAVDIAGLLQRRANLLETSIGFSFHESSGVRSLIAAAAAVDAKIVDELLGYLSSSKGSVAEFAADTLRLVAGPQLLPRLVPLLRRHPGNVEPAAKVIAAIGGEPATAALIAALDETTKRGEANVLLKALAEVSTPDALRVLRSRLRVDLLPAVQARLKVYNPDLLVERTPGGPEA